MAINTRRTYFKTATLLFKRAVEISGEGLFVGLMDSDIIMETFEEHYDDAVPGTVNKLLVAIEKVHLVCMKLNWTKESLSITANLRKWGKSFRDDNDFRSPRFDYRSEDAEKVIPYLIEKNRLTRCWRN